MGFWGGLLTGQNTTLNSDINQMGGMASFLNNTGTKDVATSSNFMNTLLSGDSSNVSKLLAPQIEGIQKRNQQQKQQLGEFGGRSGGTTGAMLASDDDVHAQINDMVAKLTGSAVSNLGTQGAGLLYQGANDLSAQAGMSQQQLENWKNSIFGKGLSTAAQGAEAFGMGGVAGKAAGGSFTEGGASALSKFLNG